MPPLYKTTIVVWTPTPGSVYQRDNSKPSYCSKLDTELVTEPVLDPDWDHQVEFTNGDFHSIDEKEKS